ncbi:uncharacterized protein LOC141634484 isoform X3 [Silene latifolia]|uniref:uncharacterized protein LOC141634484 isoform X3 n=1 Tax=Silene latifolia TaxID=37657 RepID=UPI003D788669
MSMDDLMLHFVPDSEDEDGFVGLDELEDHHCFQDSINLHKDKKRKKQEDDVGEKKMAEEQEGSIVKKRKEMEEEVNVVKPGEKEEVKLKEAVCEENEDDIDLPNLILGIYCPKFKTMKEYREKWRSKSLREQMKELKEMEKTKKMEEMKKLDYWKKMEEKK